MTRGEYQELADFFMDQLGRHQAFVAGEFERHRQETRSFVGVMVEALRSEVRSVAEGVVTNSRRLDENTRRLDENTRRLDENTRRIDALTHRMQNLESTVSGRFEDHEMRLRALE